MRGLGKHGVECGVVAVVGMANAMQRVNCRAAAAILCDLEGGVGCWLVGFKT